MALDLPKPLVDKISLSIDELRSDLEGESVRWNRPGTMHLTLKFLGEIEQQQARYIGSILDDLAATTSSFTLEVGGFGCFPNTKRPRVFWVGLRTLNESLRNLQTALEDRLDKIGFEREDREFHPHLTVGRTRKGLSSAQYQYLSTWVNAVQLGAVGKFSVETVKLLRSELRPSGAVYSELHTARLAS